MTSFPSATILGYPRIGRNRELKRALESHWAGRTTRRELDEASEQLRRATFARLTELGLGATDSSIPDASTLYDHVLDVTVLLGAIPPRFPKNDYFALARGTSDTPPLEMTKWFDTNYHYLVPEIGPDTPISYACRSVVDKWLKAREWGYVTRPVLVGPVTYLALSKGSVNSPEGWSPLERLDDVLNAYVELLKDAASAGISWIQFDEPALVTDNLAVSRESLATYAREAWAQLSELKDRPALFVTLPYGDGSAGISALASTSIEALHLDLGRGDLPATPIPGLESTILTLGIVDGRNVWRSDLAQAIHTVDEARVLGARELSVATTNSLQHVPHDTALETWDDPELDSLLHSWLAFADQKVNEVVTLGQGLLHGWETIADDVRHVSEILRSRQSSPGVVRDDVRSRVAGLRDGDRLRISSAERKALQDQKLDLPLLPTTTIGSFPQTPDIRQVRAQFSREALSKADYTARIKEEITRVIRLQEDLGIDVLVHGEAERNDMVQYFAEAFDGFAATRHGWVQSYGSRCTRPSIQWGDVSRPEAVTVEWTRFAQSLTTKHVKGMLTGPVTILAWSFPRNDLPLSASADQIALALRDEVSDLEAAGTQIIQVDEPALRELLPLDADRHDEYVAWSVGSFRLATSGVRPETQIHTHLCYSEFGQILDAIEALDADVTSIEAARSRMELLPELSEHGFERGVGPGVWDIHSPRVPTTGELTDLIVAAVRTIPADRLWINPDCGLKTRAYPETLASLQNLVDAARYVRATASL
ncbi:5-methyltetrahydropteroyltriglutamate--homocysteine S-methyltransferase [Arcanobacterium haemolyticum]|nr:5-methyltetrahydropteroyltriglutamate--homocysteine S-methyltransferase [Arcanobacterium haemolyticum]